MSETAATGVVVATGASSGATGSDPRPVRRQVENDATARLGSAAEARWIVEHVLGRRGERGVPGFREPVDAQALAGIDHLVARRLGGEPLQYVLGRWQFRTLEVLVDERVLAPRPETEQLVEVALAELAMLAPGRAHLASDRSERGRVAVDLGTGSAVIALSLAAEAPALPGAPLRVFATDDDPDALAVGAANVEHAAHKDPHAARRVSLHLGRWWDALPASLRGKVDLAVSNPPYVSEQEWPELDPEVRREPLHALVSRDGSEGTAGFAALEDVVLGAGRWLAIPGTVVVELAPHQARAAADLARRAGFTDVRVERDLAGRDRVLVARRGERR